MLYLNQHPDYEMEVIGMCIHDEIRDAEGEGGPFTARDPEGLLERLGISDVEDPQSLLPYSQGLYFPSACPPGEKTKACPAFLLLVEASSYAGFAIESLSDRFCGHWSFYAGGEERTSEDNRACGKVYHALWFFVFQAELYLSGEFGGTLVQAAGEIAIELWREKFAGGKSMSDREVVDNAKAMLEQVGAKCLGITYDEMCGSGGAIYYTRKQEVCALTPPMNTYTEHS